MAIFDNFNLDFLSSDSLTVIGSVIGFIALIFLIWNLERNRSLKYGTRSERRTFKGMGYTMLGLAYTGRGLYKLLRWGVRGSAKLEKFARNLGNKGGKLAKDSATYISKLIKGEERNLEEELHQSSAAAASVELGNVIGKLANAELNEHKAKESIELRIRFLDSHLAAISNIDVINDESKKFVIGVGEQITSALIGLAYHQGFEMNVRRKSFTEAYRLLKVIKSAERLARIIERKAIRNQKKLSKFNDMEIVDIEIYLKDRIKEEGNKIKSARAAFNNSSTADRATKSALYNQLRLEQQNVEKIRQNVERLIAILKQLKSINWRMLRTLVKIKKDVQAVLVLINDALSKEEKIQSSEKDVEEKASRIGKVSKDAQSNLNKIQDESPEEVIIALTRNSGSILNGIAEISKSILGIDKQELLPFMQSLSNAMIEAYRVEESSRLANSFYSKLMNANQRFYELVADVDFSQETKDTFTKELEIEKMEEKIAAREENVAQAAKSLFIKTRNIIENSIGLINQHIDYLNNNVFLVEDTKNYTLNILSNMMQRLSEHKVRANAEFAQKADEYQKRLHEVRFRESMAKLAA